MRKTTIFEYKKIKPDKAVLIEGLPGLGLVGKIASEYLIKQLNAVKIAELYSPHFPYYVMIDEKGKLNLLKLEFYYWQNSREGQDLILLTGDCQAQTVEGQYEVADAILDYVEEKNVKLVITLGGYRREARGEPQIFASATSRELLETVIRLGAKSNFSGSPIIGIAGILVGLAKFRGIDALCLLAETYGHRPDPKASKSLLSLLSKMLRFEIDFLDLEREISRYEELEKKIRKIQEQRIIEGRRQRTEDTEKIFYIG